jgi:predicted transposase/invertase (TIGR01784 family)
LAIIAPKPYICNVPKAKQLIRFDWALKKILRDKANFDILEGFLSVLLQENFKIKQILESESNKETDDDRHNRVDILVENSDDELVIIEIQNSKEFDYFHRMLYGTSKAIAEHIKEGKPYAEVKKVISITIAYFDLGQGIDYVYHGTTSFKGLHKHDVLALAEKQKTLYEKTHVHEIYPEYWLLKVDQFDDRVHDKLDEWIYFLKNGEVLSNFKAKGLNQAQKKLDEMLLSEKDRKTYRAYLNRLRDIASEMHNKKANMEEQMDKAMAEAKIALEKAQGEVEKAQGEVEKAQGEAQKAQNEAQKAQNEAQKAQGEAQKAQSDLEKTKAETQAKLETTVKELSKNGVSNGVIAMATQLSEAQVIEILNK